MAFSKGKYAVLPPAIRLILGIGPFFMVGAAQVGATVTTAYRDPGGAKALGPVLGEGWGEALGAPGERTAVLPH